MHTFSRGGWTVGFGVLLGGLVIAAPALAGSCVASETTLCLGADRYSVEIDWQSDTASGQGQVFPLVTSSTGYFSLDDAQTVETMVRVVDGCAINGNSWVFVSDLSEYGLTIRVSDTSTGQTATYDLALGSTHEPITDTAALACPPEESAALSPNTAPSPAAPSLAAPSLADAFTGGPNEIELVNGRFRVTVEWDDSVGGSGSGIPIPLTEASVAFWFFTSINPERLLKIEPNPDTGFYRFVSSSVSSVAQTISVFDTCTGGTDVYDQLQGVFQTIVDEQMQPIECADQVFVDSFESGNADEWSTTTPQG